MALNIQSLDRILSAETTVSSTITVNTAITLPSAANTAGKLYTIYNPSASTANVLVNASDASLVVTVQPGTAAVVTPIVDAPTTNTSWMVVSNGLNASGLKGDTSGSAKASGYVGELLIGQNSAGVSLTSGVGTNPSGCSVTLIPGDWDISAVVAVSGSATSTTTRFLEISTTQNSGFGNTYDGTDIRAGYTGNLSNEAEILGTPGIVPIRVSTPTTYYVNVQWGFSGGTATVKGTIYARRRA